MTEIAHKKAIIYGLLHVGARYAEKLFVVTVAVKVIKPYLRLNNMINGNKHNLVKDYMKKYFMFKIFNFNYNIVILV